MVIFQLGLIRGLVGQIVGTAVGLLLVTLIRLAMGLPAWKAEPAMIIGSIIGAVGFMIGVGALTDWMKWMRGQKTPMHHGPLLRHRLQP